jgi:hypothetical protein
MTPHCLNATCAIFVVCQNKAKPCPGNASFTGIVRNGYRTMQMQEFAMRASAIEFRGDF